MMTTSMRQRLKLVLNKGLWVLETLRWRGLLCCLFLSVREILKPIVGWHVFYVFANDLTSELPVSYAKEPFEVRIYKLETEIADVAPQISAFGQLTLDDIRSRASQGDFVGVAYAGNNAVGYSWMSFANALSLAFDATCIVYPHEAILYGSFVRREWRGKGIHSCLDVALNACARERGIVRTIGTMALSNRQTLALAKHTKKRRVMIVALARLRGVDRTWALAIENPRPHHSRFRAGRTWIQELTDLT